MLGDVDFAQGRVSNIAPVVASCLLTCLVACPGHKATLQHKALSYCSICCRSFPVWPGVVCCVSRSAYSKQPHKEAWVLSRVAGEPLSWDPLEAISPEHPPEAIVAAQVEALR